MEKQHQPFGMTVLQSLTQYGKEAGPDSDGKKVGRIYFTQDKGLTPIGNGLYCGEVRNSLQKYLKLPNVDERAAETTKAKKTKKNQKKKGLSKEEIIAQKTADDVKKFLPPLLANHDKIPICREGRAEFRLIQFMLYSNYVIGVLMKDPNSYLAYEGLVAMHNALASARSVVGIAPQCLIDGQICLDRLQQQARFLYEELLTVYPRLVFNNTYSELYHESIIEPYPDQKNMVDLITKQEKFLAFYNTVPGSGKTTAVVGVVARASREKIAITEEVKEENAKNLQNVKKEKADLNKGRKYKIRKRFQAQKSTKGSGSRVVIFVCTNMLVREQVGRDAYNIDIPFAVAANLIYRPHFNARSRDVLLVISDLESALMMLEKFGNTNPLLFIDEPTIAAETDHNINNKIMEIMTYAPQQTILSSATMPRVEELPLLTNMFKNLHKGSKVETITSRRIGIGCHAVFDGITVFPFENCTDIATLERTVKNLNQNPFLFRFLSIEVVVTLRERMAFHKLKFETFKEIFPNPASITHQKIADHAMELLDILLGTKDDSVIKNCCQPLTAPKYRPFNLQSLLTEDAHQHMQGALFATLDPLEKALELSKLFLKELPKIHDMLKDFHKVKEVFDRERERIEKTIKNEDRKSQALQALVEPHLNIPSRFVPNTLEHFLKFAPAGTKHDPKALQSPPITDTIPEDLDVPDEMMMLLYLGIGVYSPSCLTLNPEKKDGIDCRYTEKVVEMCSAGYISFLFADRSIVYGTNFPFSNVFIDPAFAETSSLNTLYQLIGRAGRVGRSYMAKVFLIDSKIRDRITSFSEENVEAANLEKAMKRVLDARKLVLKDDAECAAEDAAEKAEKAKKEAEVEKKKEEKKAEKEAAKSVVEKKKEEEEEEEEENWESKHDELKAAALEREAHEDDGVEDDWMNHL